MVQSPVPVPDRFQSGLPPPGDPHPSLAVSRRRWRRAFRASCPELIASGSRIKRRALCSVASFRALSRDLAEKYPSSFGGIYAFTNP